MFALYLLGIVFYLLGSILLSAVDETVFFTGSLCIVGGILILYNVNRFEYKNWEAKIYIIIGHVFCAIGVFIVLFGIYLFVDAASDGDNRLNNCGVLISGVFLFVVGMVQKAKVHKELRYVTDHGESRLKERKGLFQKKSTNIINPTNRDKISNKEVINILQDAQNCFAGRTNFKDFIHFSMDDIDDICAIEGTKRKGDLFEQYCARLLELNLFTNIKVVGGSGDKGADIIAWKGHKKVAFQCKCYSHTVPYSAFEQIVTARKNFGASEGILLTNNYFSKQTQKLAPEHQIYLWDRKKLQKLIDVANEICEENKLDVVENSTIS